MFLVGLLCIGSAPTLVASQATVYNFPIGYTQCYSCQAGSYVESEGSGQCKACGPGFYQDVNGSTFCKACPEGESFFIHV